MSDSMHQDERAVPYNEEVRSMTEMRTSRRGPAPDKGVKLDDRQVALLGACMFLDQSHASLADIQSLADRITLWLKDEK